jgi:hypothetical protein
VKKWILRALVLLFLLAFMGVGSSSAAIVDPQQSQLQGDQNTADQEAVIGSCGVASPACVGSSSRLLSGIQNARAEFDARYTPTSSFQTANVPVIITGVGFFDFQHGQTGVAPNGIELHAVLDIQVSVGSNGLLYYT